MTLLWWTPENKASAATIRHFVRKAAAAKLRADAIPAERIALLDHHTMVAVKRRRSSSIRTEARRMLTFARMRALLGGTRASDPEARRIWEDLQRGHL